MKPYEPMTSARKFLSAPRLLQLSGALLLAVSCAPQTALEIKDDESAAVFARVKPMLENNCVHCHATIRLPGMPSLTDTKALASLIGPNNLIVPGKPEQSRFYLVTTFSDSQAGAMPPTGHAISPGELAKLREWIRVGAPLPEETIVLHGEGIAPRSR